MNSLYEFGSPVDIIIRAKSDRTIGGIEYKENEIYTILKDVAVQFTYENINVALDGKKPIFRGDTQKLPTTINTGIVDCTDKILNIVGSKLNDATALITEIETRRPDSEGIILLSWPAENIFVYKLDRNGNKTSIPYTYEKDTLIVRDEEIDNDYLIVYQTVKEQQIAYSLEQEYQPYFSVEIIAKGNTDKQTRGMVLLFPSVKIDPNADLRFTNEGLLAISLRMNIIYHNQDMPTVVFN